MEIGPFCTSLHSKKLCEALANSQKSFARQCTELNVGGQPPCNIGLGCSMVQHLQDPRSNRVHEKGMVPAASFMLARAAHRSSLHHNPRFCARGASASGPSQAIICRASFVPIQAARWRTRSKRVGQIRRSQCPRCGELGCRRPGDLSSWGMVPESFLKALQGPSYCECRKSP